MRGRAFVRLVTWSSLLLVAFLIAAVPAGAATIRGHSTHRGSGGGHPIHLHGGFGFFASYYYLPHYYPYGYYYPPYPGYYATSYLPDIAYVDTDVTPEDAAVYLDGEYVGIADDYDGFPHYLAVTPGRHSISFKAEGCKSVTRSLRVPRGAVLDIDFTMPRGSGTVGQESGSDEEIVVPEYRRGQEPSDQYSDDEEEEESAPADEAEPGFVRVDVTPPDASIYIDGNLYGSSSRLSRLHGDLRLEAGRHTIEVVRPGYRAVRRTLDLKPGEHQTLDVDLQRSASRPTPPR